MELNYMQLIKSARCFLETDCVEADYFISLALLKISGINKKIEALGIKSFINYKLKNINELLVIIKKIKKMKISIRNLDNSSSYILVKIYYRTAILLKNNGELYLSLYLLNEARRIFEEKIIKDEESLSIIENNYSEILQDIKIELNRIKKDFDSRTQMLKKLNNIKNTIHNSNKIHNDLCCKDMKFYLVSSLWINKVLKFIENYEKEISGLFDLNKVIQQINRDDLNGYYPGPIKNYDIINFKPTINDTTDLISNIYLKNEIKEDKDYLFFTEDNWNYIKNIFNYDFEIERHTTYIHNELCIEINLSKFKILILSQSLNKNRIIPLYFQIARFSKVVDLKNKLKRLIPGPIREIRLYNYKKGYELYKNELVDIISTYIRDWDYDFNSNELLDEQLLEKIDYSNGDILIARINPINVISNNIIEFNNTRSSVKNNHKSIKLNSNDLNIGEINSKLNHSININEIDMRDLLNSSNCKHGLVGLKNIGNTCFMNSALQCLSACEDLTKYFLTRKYSEDINKKNAAGTRGDLANAYYELIRELWIGYEDCISPVDFRKIFVSFAKQFANFTQNDSQEMLIYMLDGLHEDLNRISDKPYNEIRLNGNEIDNAKKSWNNHLSREDSIIVDLFHGQYKSVITCPSCLKVSVNFDPFMYLGLPIPNNVIRVTYKFFPIFDGTFKYHEMDIEEDATVQDIKSKIFDVFNIQIKSLEVICLKDLNSIKVIGNEEKINYYIKENNEILVYQKFKIGDNERNVSIYIFPIDIIEENIYIFFKKDVPTILFYPSLITMGKEDKIENLYLYLFKIYRKIINDYNNNVSEFYHNYNNETYILNEFKIILHKLDSLLTLFIFNNIQEKSGLFSLKDNCEFCNSNCIYCPLSDIVSMRDSVEYLFSKIKHRNVLILYIRLINYNKHIRFYNNIEFPKTETKQNQKKTSINIYDCINLFRKDDLLEKDNSWYCNKCKEFREAKRRLEIYKCPNVLIIQLKRFKFKCINNSYSNSKNESIIEFPVDGLDLNEIIQGDSDSKIYDLFAISRHYGKMSSGHYTALCRNIGNWYEFDDDRVTRVLSNDIVSEAAYILFYRKRNLK